MTAAPTKAENIENLVRGVGYLASACERLAKVRSRGLDPAARERRDKALDSIEQAARDLHALAVEAVGGRDVLHHAAQLDKMGRSLGVHMTMLPRLFPAVEVAQPVGIDPGF